MLVTQSCPTLCNTMDCSLPGFSVHGIPQARILEWVATPFSRGSSQFRDQTLVSCTAGDSLSSESSRKPHSFIFQAFIMHLIYTRLFCPWDSPGKNTGVGCHFLLQGIFLTHGLNPPLLCHLHWQASSLQLCCLGSPQFSSVQLLSPL